MGSDELCMLAALAFCSCITAGNRKISLAVVS
ncbi:hypothetical protein UC8_20920 [Roseimaritima ulvae]|uniref:Uncharacterized protein n=1 Tax=Roseimaritima ulvae TaxID=980254 RepID=A0A5B9QM16_9BACT|nr:hypothetical protein UC8_20920 [Roseimaritima ulvae]